MPGGGQQHALWLDSQRLEKDGTGGLESAWKGLVSSGQDAKVGVCRLPYYLVDPESCTLQRTFCFWVIILSQQQ